MMISGGKWDNYMFICAIPYGESQEVKCQLQKHVGKEGSELSNVWGWKKIWGTFDVTQAVVGEQLCDGPPC